MPLPNENVFTEPFRLYPMAPGPWSLNRSASQLWPLSIGVMTAIGTPSRSTRRGRSHRSHCDIRRGSAVMMTS